MSKSSNKSTSFLLPLPSLSYITFLSFSALITKRIAEKKAAIKASHKARAYFAAGAFGFYAGLCFLGWIFVLACFPETEGLSLEEVKMVFKDGFGIQESQRLIKAKRSYQKWYSDSQGTTYRGHV